jgi:hypothetical protein
MRKVNFTYSRTDLGELLIKEEEVLARISPYCEDSGKTITTSYYASVETSSLYTLEIEIKDERKS